MSSGGDKKLPTSTNQKDNDTGESKIKINVKSRGELIKLGAPTSANSIGDGKTTIFQLKKRENISSSKTIGSISSTGEINRRRCLRKELSKPVASTSANSKGDGKMSGNWVKSPQELLKPGAQTSAISKVDGKMSGIWAKSPQELLKPGAPTSANSKGDGKMSGILVKSPQELLKPGAPTSANSKGDSKMSGILVKSPQELLKPGAQTSANSKGDSKFNSCNVQIRGELLKPGAIASIDSKSDGKMNSISVKIRGELLKPEALASFNSKGEGQNMISINIRKELYKSDAGNSNTTDSEVDKKTNLRVNNFMSGIPHKTCEGAISEVVMQIKSHKTKKNIEDDLLKFDDDVFGDHDIKRDRNYHCEHEVCAKLKNGSIDTNDEPFQSFTDILNNQFAGITVTMLKSFDLAMKLECESLSSSTSSDIEDFLDTRIEDEILFFENDWYQRGHFISVEGELLNKFSAAICHIGKEHIWVQKTSDNSTFRFHINNLLRGEISISPLYCCEM